MPSDVRNRSPSPPSRRASGVDRHSRSRSRSPRRHQTGVDPPAESHRYRSRSPKPRSPPADDEAKPKTKKIASGFKFKERSAVEGHHDNDRDQATKGLERGYRHKGVEGKDRPSTYSSDAISEKFGAGASVKDKFGDVRVAELSGSSSRSDKPGEAKKEKRKEKSKPSVAQPALEMIVVYVNDRLGTRAQIMCSPSDTISMPLLAQHIYFHLLDTSSTADREADVLPQRTSKHLQPRRSDGNLMRSWSNAKANDLSEINLHLKITESVMVCNWIWSLTRETEP